MEAVADSVEIGRSPTRVTLPNMVILGPRYEHNYGYSPEKSDPLRPAFQSHSRTLEPTRIDRLRWLLISDQCTMDLVPTSYRFQDKRRHRSKTAIYPAPCRLFNESCNGCGTRKKHDWCPYQTAKKSDDMSIRSDTIPALDGETDRQNC